MDPFLGHSPEQVNTGEALFNIQCSAKLSSRAKSKGAAARSYMFNFSAIKAMLRFTYRIRIKGNF